MNGAHQHLIINHFPAIGLVLALIVLLIGILAKSSVTRRVGLFLFFISAVTALPAMSTGEGAEGIVDQLRDPERHMIHEHEEKAEAMMPYMWGIIFLSLIALFLEWKKKSMAVIASITVLLVGMIAIYFARETNNSGAEISHPEIRKGFKAGAHDESYDED